MSAKQVQWNGRLVADAAEVPDLDVAAAIHQFGGGVTRQEAEERAYGDYRKRQAAEAAAHHLRLYRAALGAGDRDVANRHKLMYDVHVRALGENPAGEPPQQVKALVGDGVEAATKFKPHPADGLPLTKKNVEQKKFPTDRERAKQLLNRFDVGAGSGYSPCG